jgi:histidinol-phosphate aminotransferase
VNRYPIRSRLALKPLAAQRKISNQILLGNGSDEVLIAFFSLCEPSTDNVITLPPTYGMYGVLANINNVENKEVLLSTDFEPQVDAI